MFKFFIKINIILFLLASSCLSEIINTVNTSGNKRISKETIIVFGKIDLKKNYNQADLNLILKNLYETNFFKDIKLSVNDKTLNIQIIENPIIESIEINGLKKSSFKELILDKLTLKSRNSFNESIFLGDVNTVKNILKTNGYYFSTIKTSSLLNQERNSIKVIYNIDLGEKAKIKKIKFIGDKKFKDRKLSQIIVSEESKFWKFISQSIYLDFNRIQLDKRLLLNFYKNNGYYNISIKDSFVELNDMGDFSLTYSIQSGQKFFFNNLSLEMPTDFDEKYFLKIKNLLSSLKNETYSLNKVNTILKEVEKIALSKDYNFLDADLSETIVSQNKLDIKIILSETEKFYIEKINILGNRYTIEEVIRNSFIVDEGDPYNEILFNKSINLLKSKNIFGSVDSNIKDGSKPGLAIIDISVEEKATGEISLGAGVGTSGGTIGGGVKENNFMGKGISLNTNLLLSENSVKGKFVYSKPNFNDTDNTLFTSISSTSNDNLVKSGYKTSNLAFSLGTSFQQFEDLYFSPEIATSYESLKTGSSASSNLQKQSGDYFDIYFNYGLSYDQRNKSYKPTDGYKTSFYQKLPLTSENYEIVNSFDFVQYQNFMSEMVGRFAFHAKAVNAFTNEVRVSKRLFIPQSKLRGFVKGKVGPKENNDYIGGNYISTINLSTTLPQILPTFQNTDIALFLDAANMWGVDYNSSIDKNEIRSSFGLAIDLLTPAGPLNFSLSQPITKSSTDETETFRFNLGTTF